MGTSYKSHPNTSSAHLDTQRNRDFLEVLPSGHSCGHGLSAKSVQTHVLVCLETQPRNSILSVFLVFSPNLLLN